MEQKKQSQNGVAEVRVSCMHPSMSSCNAYPASQATNHMLLPVFVSHLLVMLLLDV